MPKKHHSEILVIDKFLAELSSAKGERFTRNTKFLSGSVVLKPPQNHPLNILILGEGKVSETS